MLSLNVFYVIINVIGKNTFNAHDLNVANLLVDNPRNKQLLENALCVSAIEKTIEKISHLSIRNRL